MFHINHEWGANKLVREKLRKNSPKNALERTRGKSMSKETSTPPLGS